MSQAEPLHPSFLQLVRAERLPSRWHWGVRDTLTVVSIPLILLLGLVYAALGLGEAQSAVADTALRIVIFAGLVIVNAPLLARHWRHFTAAAGRSWLLVIVGIIAVQVVVGVVGALLRGVGEGSGASTGDQPSDQAIGFGVLLFASFGPMVTALIEDFVFRHTLLLKLPFWNNAFSATVLVVVNALLFGAIHINNFGGQWLLTLSYAAAGLLMNLVYLWTRNIWHVLLMHGLNNFLLAGPLGVLVVQLVGGQ